MTPVVSFKVSNEKHTLEVTLAFSGFLTEPFESDKTPRQESMYGLKLVQHLSFCPPSDSVNCFLVTLLY